MFAASLKLLAVTAAVLGPFLAGASLAVTVPEVRAFFVIAGCGAGLAGLFGFAGIEAGERRQFDRHLGREG
jgi:hypothetical protein